MYKIRLKFSKSGPIRFIGHLDVMRYFQKAMRRAGVDIAYSEGYSPHQQMSFAHPLPAGATGEGEYMDISLRSFADLRDDASFAEGAEDLSEEARAEALSELQKRLNAVMREGISITDAAFLPQGAQKAMTAVGACAWRVRLSGADEAGSALLARIEEKGSLSFVLDAFLSRSQITVLKKTKKGETQTDIRPLIFAVSGNDRTGEMTLLLRAGSEDNVKPALFLQALAAELSSPLPLSQASFLLHRTETYRMQTEEGRILLFPLIDSDPARRIALPEAD